MALINAYLMTTRNLEDFLNAIRTAKAPERFNYNFLKQLDFTSSNDRMFVSLLKGLGFLDDAGAPTKRYFDFLDQTQSGRVIAEALREAYEDLFAVRTDAHTLTTDEVKNKLRTLTQGQKSEKVVTLMANTFTALAALADWSKPESAPTSDQPKPALEVLHAVSDRTAATTPPPTPPPVPPTGQRGPLPINALHYNIQIHLPASRDTAVYDAIFQALAKHLGG